MSNMKTIIIIICVALLPSIIQGAGSSDSNNESDYSSDGRPGKRPKAFVSCSSSSRSSSEVEIEDANKPLHDTIAKVDKIMKKGGTINNIFKPLQFLGCGGYSVNYRGELGKSKKVVAMKMSPISMSEGDTLGEYLMYTYMKAVNNLSVEDYGIPAVHYYHADWEGCTLLALSLLEPQYTQLIETPGIRLSDLDMLIIMREFVRISKYIHGNGVCHGDMSVNNMMFRRNQAFVIDFNWSGEVNLGVKPDSDCRKADWNKFLITLCQLGGIDVNFHNDANTVKTIADIKDNDGLRFVLLHFAKHAMKIKNAEPINYNQMHQRITHEIRKRGVPEPALVSWLTDTQKNEARDEWSTKQTPPIESIAEPKTHYTYPEPILDYFHNFE